MTTAGRAAGPVITTPFGFASTAADVIAGIDLHGRRTIVTGAASGIGIETEGWEAQFATNHLGKLRARVRPPRSARRYGAGADPQRQLERPRSPSTPARKTAEQGAATSVLLATAPLVDGIDGRYFEDGNDAAPATGGPGGAASYALDPANADRLSEESLRLLA